MNQDAGAAPDRAQAARSAAAVLTARGGELEELSCVVGFDGFVDDILDAVRGRRSMAMSDYERIATIEEFAARVGAAAGVSTNIELVRRESRFGGNGPLLASGLIGLGMRTSYVGCVGDGAGGVHGLFEGFASRCARVVPIGPPGHTDALEFDDGKIMFNQTSAVQGADWSALVGAVGVAGLRELVGRATVVGIVNWSLCGGVEGIWRGLIDEVLPGLEAPPDGGRRRVFIDLSDPAKRSDADIAGCVAWLGRMNRVVPVTLGLNLAEARRVGAVLGVGAEGGGAGRGAGLCDLARGILDRAGVSTVVVHPREGAAGATRGIGGVRSCWIDGPVAERPRLSTGAGDHFNAGLAAGEALGLSLPECLSVATASSGCYVRDAASPGVGRVVEMLRAVGAGRV